MRLIRPDLSFPVIEQLSQTTGGSLTVAGADVDQEGRTAVTADLPNPL